MVLVTAAPGFITIDQKRDTLDGRPAHRRLDDIRTSDLRSYSNIQIAMGITQSAFSFSLHEVPSSASTNPPRQGRVSSITKL
jgi:hypothetical protein